jgi:hypothetical protein
MNLLNILKECEQNISQIARDAGLERQSVYLWQNGRIPRKSVFNRLAAMDKYKNELSKLDYEYLRMNTPLGRKVGSKNKKAPA